MIKEELIVKGCMIFTGTYNQQLLFWLRSWPSEMSRAGWIKLNTRLSNELQPESSRLGRYKGLLHFGLAWHFRAIVSRFNSSHRDYWIECNRLVLYFESYIVRHYILHSYYPTKYVANVYLRLLGNGL